VAHAVFELRGAELHTPPASLLDTLLLANLYARMPSPLGAAAPVPDEGVVDAASLQAIILEAAELGASMEQAVLV
jgi:hypothetical protein